MEKMTTREWELYRDIRQRTNGEIYIGVVGPVRSGKSTFIKRFMELCVFPFMEDELLLSQTVDELPQSAQGKTIMTTEPKFVPAQAVEIPLEEQTKIKIRLIDCVGFMVQGVEGHMEDGKERMVHTPWYDTEVPFSKAARIGTEKVIHEHSTLGVVITTDGSFTNLERGAYEASEREAIQQLTTIAKPFVIILNCQRPFSEETKSLCDKLKQQYGRNVIPMNIEQMTKDDAFGLLLELLMEFPVTKINFQIPGWTKGLPLEHKIYKELILNAKAILKDIQTMNQLSGQYTIKPQGIVEKISKQMTNPANGEVTFEMTLPEQCYYENISELTGEKIESEYELIELIRQLARAKNVFEKVEDAFQAATQKGYGVVMPQLTDIEIEEPQIVKHGNKYGIRMKALAPSVHLIKANIETEIAPIIGTKQQAEGLMEYMREGKETEEGFLNINIFGKSVGELVEDGIRTKIAMMDEDSQMKLQDTMQKIVNDNNGGMICIII